MERALAGRFRLEEKIGGDDVVEVHRARDVRDDKPVRVHLLRVESGSRRERMLREAKRAAQVRHDGLVAIVDVGRTDDDQAFVVTDAPEGEPLDVRIAKGALELDKTAAIATQICRALAFAHDTGVVHRDLRPSRVFVREDGSVSVAGIGLPHATAGRDDAYVAPEQRRGEPASRRADVYSLGAIMHAMLTGAAPPAGGGHAEGPLGAIVSRALAADPRDRFVDTNELEGEIRRALAPTTRTGSLAPGSLPPPSASARLASAPPSKPPAGSKPPSKRPLAQTLVGLAPFARAPDAPPSEPELPAEAPRPSSRPEPDATARPSSRPDPEVTESSRPRSDAPRRASNRPAGAERRAPAAPPPREPGRPLQPRPAWEDAALDVLDGPAPRMLGAMVLAFIVARIVTAGLVPWLVAVVAAAAGYVSWRMSRPRTGA
ncbi:MAG TPA: protein kinase [Labilithrix sp.]